VPECHSGRGDHQLQWQSLQTEWVQISVPPPLALSLANLPTVRTSARSVSEKGAAKWRGLGDTALPVRRSGTVLTNPFHKLRLNVMVSCSAACRLFLLCAG